MCCRPTASSFCLTRADGRVRWSEPLPRFEDPENRKRPIRWAGPVLRRRPAGGGRARTATALSVSPYTGERSAGSDLGGTLHAAADRRRRHALFPHRRRRADRAIAELSELHVMHTCPSPSPSSAGPMSANRRCSTGWSAAARARRRHAGRDPRPPRGRGAARRSRASRSSTPPGSRMRATRASRRACARRPSGAVARRRRRALHDRCARRRDAARRAFRRAAARRGKPVVAGRQQDARAAPAQPALLGGLRARASASRSPISAEHGEGMADLYEALRPMPRSRRRPSRRRRRGEAEASRGDAPAAAARHRRAAQRRQVDPGQPLDRRGAAADRPGGRASPATRSPSTGNWRRPRRSGWSTPRACAARPGSRRSSRSSRSATRCAPIRFAEVVILVHRRDDPFEKQDLTIADLVERGGPRAGLRAQQVGPGRGPAGDAGRRCASGSSASLPQVRGVADRARSPARPARLDKLMPAVLQDPCGLEPPHSDGRSSTAGSAMRRRAHPPPAGRRAAASSSAT